MKRTDIKVYGVELFKPYTSIVHGIFTRAGGTSTGPFESLNMGMMSGDEHACIEKNRHLVFKEMGSQPLVFLNQIHGCDILVLKNDDNAVSQNFQSGREIFTADGIITDMKNVGLVIQVADCQAVMLYDFDKKVIANVHSGWRGSIKNIIGKCIDKMVLGFGCVPENIIAGISPSLGPCCSEFLNYKDEIPKRLWKYKINDTPCFDFWEMSKDQLMGKGVKKDHIENMKICTKCNTDVFFSFRGEKPTGRFACVISMK